MTRPTKRAQVEALGWVLTAIPRRWEAGALWTDSRTGLRNAAHDDYKRPDAWVVTPPPGRGLPPRRFENASPIPAVRWAWEQAMAPEPTVAGGVAALVLLATNARRSGVVVEGVGEPPTPTRPDAELLALCREIAGCEQIAEAARGCNVPVWEQPIAFKAMQERLNEACRDKERLIPLALELEATTPAGVLAKSRVVLELFARNCNGRKKAAVTALVEDLARVLGQLGTAG